MSKQRKAKRQRKRHHKSRPIDVKRRYLDRPNAANYLGFSEQKLILEIRKGAITEHEFGPHCKRYLIEDLDAYAAARRNSAKEAA